MSESSNKSVLVIGGGCAGVSFISGLRKLDPTVDIILVEPKDFCELIWACYRSPFDEQVAKASTIPLKEYCEEKRVTHLRSKVKSLTETMATLEDGTIIEFTAAVITVGANMPWKEAGNGLPNGYEGNREERLERLRKHGERLLNAKKVVVIGGGLVGVELAGDVAGYGKQKQTAVEVTLVHSGASLVPEFSSGASNMVQSKLEKLGVKIILNERGYDQKNGKVLLQNSKEQPEDVDEIISVVGLSSHNSFVKIDGVFNEKGFLKTDEHSRLIGHNNIFAYGDCAQELRNAAYLIMHNGPVVANNVMVAMEGKPDSDLKVMDTGMNGGMVTIGPNDGVAQLPFTYTQYLLPRIKNYTMMLPTSKPLMGLKATSCRG